MITPTTTTRFVYANVADLELGALIYTGAAPPSGYALLAVASGYALANVLQHSRYTVVKLMDTNGLIDIDLGSAKNVEALALMNVYLDSGSSYPVIKLYSSADNVTWDDHGEMFDSAGWVGVKDRVFRLPAVYPRRYWRLHVTTATAWYLGNVFLGSYYEFADGIFSPGSTYVRVPPQTRIRTAAGLPVTHVLGQKRERFVNRYDVFEDDFQVVLSLISESGKPFGYVHYDNGLRHVVAAEGGIELEAFMGPPMTWNATVEMEQLP